MVGLGLCMAVAYFLSISCTTQPAKKKGYTNLFITGAIEAILGIKLINPISLAQEISYPAQKLENWLLWVCRYWGTDRFIAYLTQKSAQKVRKP